MLSPYIIKDPTHTINAEVYDIALSVLIGQYCKTVVQNNEHINMNSPVFMEKVI